jgi:hypothetical protein
MKTLPGIVASPRKPGNRGRPEGLSRRYAGGDFV